MTGNSVSAVFGFAVPAATWPPPYTVCYQARIKQACPGTGQVLTTGAGDLYVTFAE